MYMTKYNEDIYMLRHMLDVLMTKQSSSELNSTEKKKCKKGIRALRAAVDAIETQVYA